jgi:spore coat protein U-like protein
MIRSVTKTGIRNFFSALLVGFVAFFGIVSSAMAATDTDNLNINANVNAVGRIVSAGDVDFGNYDPTDTSPNNANGSVAVRATKGIDYKLYISETGLGVRQMDDAGSELLDFELYTNAGRTIRWEEDSASAPSYTSTSNALSTKNIYGQVPALQNVAVGIYFAQLIVTMEF